MDGIINVYKEKGYTSFDVVAKLRRILGQKKIGHTGTLDPDATGVLPICLGKGTKLVEYLTDKDKEYHAHVKLGITTDTLDISGKVTSEHEVSVNESDIIQVAGEFVGDILQTPPMYSAIKVGGKKLYELARKDTTIERAKRPVTIHSLNITDIDLTENVFSMYVCVSKGTYIRSLADDIGKKLGCGACLLELERTRSGTFLMNDALTISEIEDIVNEKGLDELEKSTVKIPELLKIKSVILKNEYDDRVHNGNTITDDMYDSYTYETDKACINTGENDLAVFYSDGTFAAIYRKDEDIYKVLKMFY
ncbi:MAG: tRNA pseudouridine(55) synthase TruB [Lachnospiraceae bacterium]|nr:tRNA pseudouridine(55) synthase TruB [Lachnospiraceae bacterium]